MENKLDKLFKSKLSGFEQTPSGQAWDHIEGRLSSARKALWARRLSIAASMLLIATLGYFGYQSIYNTENDQNQDLADTKDIYSDKEIMVKDIPENDGEKENEDKQSVDLDNANMLQSAATAPAATDVNDLDRSMNVKKRQKAEPKTEQLLLAEANIVDEELMLFPKTNKIAPVEGEAAESNNLENDAESEQKVENQFKGTQKFKLKNKSYPKIKIIYKADQNSKLVTSNKQSIFDKGINKITEFSDEHLLTVERKNKLRNTRDDLLALNFSKLLNKSDKDQEE